MRKTVAFLCARLGITNRPKALHLSDKFRAGTPIEFRGHSVTVRKFLREVIRKTAGAAATDALGWCHRPLA